MVLIRRQTPCPAKISTRDWTSSIAYGDGRRMTPKSCHVESPIMSNRMIWSPENNMSLSHPKTSFTFEQSPQRRWGIPQSALKVFYVLVAMSWLGAIIMMRHVKARLETSQQDQRVLLEATANDNNIFKSLHSDEISKAAILQRNIEELKHENAMLQHELRMLAAQEEDTADENNGELQHGSVLSYMESRQTLLQHKVKTLEEYIQNESREALLQKYGPAPHRVEFTVQFSEDNTKPSFIIEVASDLMPHSSKLFLDQIHSRLWDNAVFWHHEGVDHVISSAAILHKTGDTRYHHFDALHVGGVRFAEYSPQMPHVPWTVGFAGKGPEFYINTVDNTQLHGPGGNAHHENAPDEGDPCFGRVVSGLSVVKQMYELSKRQSEQSSKYRRWHDNELTHIIKAQILVNN